VVPQSSSVAAALDIAKGKFELSSLRAQGIALVEQATSAVQAVVNPGQFGIQFPSPRNFV
jgi:kynureninase